MYRKRDRFGHHRSKVRAAQAAMEQGFAELYATHGDGFNLQDVEQSWREHNGPMGLKPEEFEEAGTRFFVAAYLKGNGGRDGK